MTIEEIMYGVQLGYKLARMEFIWDSKFEEARAVFKESKEELLSILKQKGCFPEEDNYRQFTESILTYFGSNNMNIFSTILIGVGSFRNMMAINVRDDNPNKEEMFSLARSAFDGIPAVVVPNPRGLYEEINNAKAENVMHIVSIVSDYLNIGSEKKDSVDNLFF